MAYIASGRSLIDNDKNFIAGNVVISGSTAGLFIEAAPTSPLYGTNYGFASGGSPNSNVIDRFPFATNANATDYGDLTVARLWGTGQSSTLHGYVSGGHPELLNVIDRFPFASAANASDVGDLTEGKYGTAGHSSATHGFVAGGYITNYIITNNIDRFPFASNANATDYGDLTTVRDFAAGQSSDTHGYTSGGISGSPAPTASKNIIDKFPFASAANATDVGDLTVGRYSAAGQSSVTHGYTSGGISGAPLYLYYNIIDKFPFASDANASDVGDLTGVVYSTTGVSSSTHGYSAGTTTPGPYSSAPTSIEKFPFATNTNASAVGNLSVSRTQLGSTGQQD